ncbi:MAG: biotin--[acetyl-CoA-carboxylase] ligase [Caldilineaceae bacterium]|nr:biotin--[acetyl-CoA-carboxylase] ligase [Caldilineaceae bacterium]MCY4116937.1 biotin--[acetyl-CoA-carboxylase] ligase [Caldilineaceae bacterium]
MSRADRTHRGAEPRETEDGSRSAQSPPPEWIVNARTALSGRRVGRFIEFYSSAASTMPLARRLIETRGDEAAGGVIIADEQTAGRGRLQRSWVAPPGRGLLGSYILCGDLLPEPRSQAVMLAGLAVLDAVRHCCPQGDGRFRLKWPNDVIAIERGGPVKLAGILVETVFNQDALRGLILGIGINVNQRADELAATRRGGLPPSSLSLVCGQTAIHRGELLAALCRALDQLCAPASRLPAETVHARWERALFGLGAVVTAPGAIGPVRGRAAGTTPDGALLVHTDGGDPLEIHSGDVVFEWNTA